MIRRVGISMRVDDVPHYSERRDGVDQAWARMLGDFGMGLLPIGLMNGVPDPESYIEALQLDAIVMTGGNDPAGAPSARNASHERDAVEHACLSYAARTNTPVLAVCRGFQYMNLFLGGALVNVEGHVRQAHQVNACDRAEYGLGQSELVNSFHTLAINREGLADPLVAAYICEDGTIEAAHHETHPWLCVMWHPERDGGAAATQHSLVQKFFRDLACPA